MTETAAAPLAAAIQMSSRADVGDNLRIAGEQLKAAADAGARLAALPENFAYMGVHEADKLAIAEADGDGPIQDFLARTSAALKLWIVAGTVPIAVAGDPNRVWPACLVYDAAGLRVARYDKVHLFDVELPGGERYRESRTIAAGNPAQAIVVDTPIGRLGLSVCYDLRFPELYRRLSDAGAEVLCVPAAFTERTGEAHWDILLRARAIENQCHVIAPAQYGRHASGRCTWGHSLIADPWGLVLAEQADGDAAVVAAIDAGRRAQVRQSFPALQHRRLA